METTIANRILPLPIADMPLDKIQKMHVEAWVRTLNEQGYSANSVKLALWTVRSVFEDAVENDLIAKNPARRVLPPRAAPKETPRFSDDETAALMTAGGPLGLPIRLLLLCGLRRGELIALRVEDVDLGARLLVVDESVDDEGYKCTKTRKVRVAPLPPGLASELAEHIRTCSRAGREPLLVNPHTGNRWGGFRLCENIKTAAESVGVADAYPRRFRTTFASLIEADIADVQAILGHGDSAMTLAHYKRSVQDRARRSVDDFEAKMKRPRGKKKGVA